MAEQPKTQSCGNCRYGLSYATLVLMETLCQRNPPSVDTSTGRTQWPPVSTQWWCGEWSPTNPETLDEGAVTLARFVLLGDRTAARALADKLKE